MKNRHHLKWRAAALAAAAGILACKTLNAQQAGPLKIQPAASAASYSAPREAQPASGETGKGGPRFFADTSISLGGNSLEVVGMDPATNSALALGQKLYVRIHYYNGGKNPVNVFARPYFKGERAAGSKSKPSRRYKNGEGEVEQWFFFDQPALVDEIRVTMVDANSKDTVLALSLPVQMTWGKRELRQSSPSM